jgi:hypothetical protein
VKELVGSEDLKEQSEGSPAEEDIKELYVQCSKCKAPKKPLISMNNFSQLEVPREDPLDTVVEYLANCQRAVKLCTLPTADDQLIEEEIYNQILDLLLDEEEETRMADNSRLISEYLLRLAYKEMLVVVEDAQIEKDADEDGDEPENPEEPDLAFICKRLRNTNRRNPLVVRLATNPLSTPFAYELVRFAMGDRDIDLSDNETSDNIIHIFSCYLRQSLEQKSTEDILKTGAFGLNIIGQLSFRRFSWTPNITVGVIQLQEKFTQERVNMSTDYFVPGSEYYSFQKTKVVKEIKVASEDQKRKEDEPVTVFDRPEYPSMKDFISKLKKDNSYVTEDFDWKCVIYDFQLDTFRCLQYAESCDHIPYGLCDYAYFFGSRCLGWAKDTTLNILICTDRKLRYLNCLMKNINLFVAPNETTPLRYLVEYIYRSTNVQLSKSGTEEDEFKEILQSLKFGIKFSSNIGWFKESDMDVPLVELRNRINPNFSRDSRQVDLICLFRHAMKPQLVSYRSKEKRRLGEKVDIHPVYRKVESIKCSASTVINYFYRWILGPKLDFTFGKPAVHGHYVSTLLPCFILLDVRLYGQLLFNPLENIDFDYVGHLLKDVDESHNHRYKLRGIICKRNEEGSKYFPVAIKSNMQGFKSFESGWVKDAKQEDIPDAVIAFVLIEREAPTI